MGMAFIGVLAILFGGSGGGSRGSPAEAVGLALAFVVSVIFIVAWVMLPFCASQYLYDNYQHKTNEWTTVVCCTLWYGGTLALNYKLAVRAERRHK